jgi:hypothetical protein
MFCTQCGAKNVADAHFCHKCGSALSSSPPQTKASVNTSQSTESAIGSPGPTSHVMAEEHKKKIFRWIRLGTTVVVCVIIYLFIDNSISNSRNSQKQVKETIDPEEASFRLTAPFTLNCGAHFEILYAGALEHGTEKFSISVSPKDFTIYIFDFEGTGFVVPNREEISNKRIKISEVSSDRIRAKYETRLTYIKLNRKTGEYDIDTRGKCYKANEFREIPPELLF